MSNGDNSFSTLSDDISSIETFENNVLPRNQIPATLEEYEGYFNMSESEINNLSPNESARIAVRLSQYAIFIQRVLNKDKARAQWLKWEIKKIIAPKINQYSGGWELQEQQAILDDEIAAKRQAQLFVVDARIESLNNISFAINRLADQFKNLKFYKTK